MRHKDPGKQLHGTKREWLKQERECKEKGIGGTQWSGNDEEGRPVSIVASQG